MTVRRKKEKERKGKNLEIFKKRKGKDEWNKGESGNARLWRSFFLWVLFGNDGLLAGMECLGLVKLHEKQVFHSILIR